MKLIPIIYFYNSYMFRVGGLIQYMVWDSSGERLAVMFKGEITLFYNSYMFRVGGLIHHMVWDSSGERLAVIFKGEITNKIDI